MRTINVGVVDPETKLVTQMKLTPQLESYYTVIGCSTIEAVSLGGGMYLYIDEEAKLKDPKPTFSLAGTRIRIMGRAILLRVDDDGDARSATEDEILQLTEMVRFP